MSLGILNEIVELYDDHKDGYPPNETDASSAVAGALFNKGVTLGALERSEEEIGVYDEVVRRFG
ncbi:MAG: hypothetical protein AAB270_01965, partial [Chloroflexota bacterium]